MSRSNNKKLLFIIRSKGHRLNSLKKIEIEIQIQGNVQLQNIYIYIYIHEHYLPIFSSAIHNILQCIQDFIFNGCS